MSLRSVEMQIALPRTGDAAIAQSQLQQKPVHEQELLHGSAVKQAEHQRQMSAKVDEAGAALIRDGGEGGGKRHEARKPQQRRHVPNDQGKSGHPFKGHNIDFSL